AEAPAGPPNVIVYVVDSLRADHLGAYGYAGGTSPALDRFAEQATLFLHPSAQSSWTRTGVASILTGADPWQHGVQGRLDALAEDVPFLPEVLAARGYRTAGFVTNGNLSAGFGFGRGFETYEHLPETTSEWVHVTSADLHARVLEWIDDGREDPRPFFLYIHSTDPHYPYRLDLGVEESVPLESPQWGSVARVVDLQLGRAQAEIGELEATVELYDREIAYNDHHFGLLVDSLRDRGLWRDALMVYTADHGEEFLDHGGWGHGQTLELEQLHVPLVIRFPRQSQGLRIGNLVSQNDIAPTILGYLGATWPDGRGQSLMPLVRPEPVPWNRVSLASLQLDGFSLASARFGTFFWIEKSATDGKFIHLTADPFGHRDQSASFPGWRDYLSAILARAPQPRASTAVTPDREVEKTLKSLGYI
ncbi:MAG: sulfatase, partial [Acidobacteriota bacterium]